VTPRRGALLSCNFSWGARVVQYKLRLERRRNIRITVHPDASVTVVAPTDVSFVRIERVIHSKRAWIVTKLEEFERYFPQAPERRFVSGETHRYLGRQYRLKVLQGPTGVQLHAGRLFVAIRATSNHRAVARALDAWYRARALSVFAERLERVLASSQRLRGLEPRIRVRLMRRRWGSCAANGTITLNLELIKAPVSCIDYVIGHEVCHMLERSHSRRFYDLLGAVSPNWVVTRERLNRYAHG